MKNLSVKKIGYLLVFLIDAFLFTGSLFYFYNGSFEEFPTFEQQEKIRIVMGSFSLFFLMIGIFLFLHVKKSSTVAYNS